MAEANYVFCSCQTVLSKYCDNAVTVRCRCIALYLVFEYEDENRPVQKYLHIQISQR